MLLFTFVVEGEEKYLPYSPPVIDEKLLFRIGQDDMEAFAELYEKTERTLYAYVLSILRSHEEALDIVHDTYLKIRAAAHLYEPHGKPMAWIFTIARNLSVSRQRTYKRRDDYQTEDLENDLSFSYVTDPEDKLVLISVLERLKEEERSIILLHAVSGMKHQEIARSMGLPISTVLSRYQRGLKKLRKYLNEGGAV